MSKMKCLDEGKARELTLKTEHAETTNNMSALRGYLLGDFFFSHEYQGQQFYKTKISVERNSGTKDIIPVIVSESIFKTLSNNLKGKYVEVTGQMYSHDIVVSHVVEGVKHHLCIFFLAESITEKPVEDENSNNRIYLRGKLCDKVFLRELKNGMKVLDFFIAVPKQEGGRNHIPCVAWRGRACFINTLNPGTYIEITGRIQSRKYSKRNPLNPEEIKLKTVYEVAVSKVQLI